MFWKELKDTILISWLNPFRVIINGQDDLDDYLVKGRGYVLPPYSIIRGDVTISVRDRPIVVAEHLRLEGNLSIVNDIDPPFWVSSVDPRLAPPVDAQPCIINFDPPTLEGLND